MIKLLNAIFSDIKVVVITGISTLSGTPDFKGKNGLYKQSNTEWYLI